MESDSSDNADKFLDVTRCHRTFEELLTAISSEFVDLDVEQIDEGINHALQAIGKFCEADRSYLFLFSNNGEFMSNTHEWCEDGVEEMKDRIQNSPVSNMPYFTEVIFDSRVFQFEHIDELPQEATAEREEMGRAQGIKSLVCVPMCSRGKLIGFLGLDTVHKEKRWDAEVVQLLKITGYVILQALFRKKSEEDLVESQEYLKQAQKMEAVGRLAGGVAHDFNNMLTVIFGCCDELLGNLPKETINYDDVVTIKKAAMKAGGITRQLLAFGRSKKLRLEVVDIGVIIHEMEDLLKSLIGENIQIQIQVDEELWKITADRGQMEQTITNLVVNARDAIEGRGDLFISAHNVTLDEALVTTIQELEAGDYLVLKIKDSGSGIDKETMQQIFEPFFSTKERGRGTGLGLSLVYSSVKQLSGGIIVESDLGKGTSFSLYFPRAFEESNSEDNTLKPQQSILEAGDLKTVLVAEDQDAVRSLVRKILNRQGFKVLEAEDGQEALELARVHEGKIDLLITDVMMPLMGGLELVKALETVRPDLKVLFMSGYTEDNHELVKELNGKDNFLGKPFSREELCKKVMNCLQSEN